MDFIAQPDAKFRIGDFLKTGFADKRWTVFRAAVAFVKGSGTKHISAALEDFVKRGAVSISAGVDGGGTSAEGLRDLLRATHGRGKVFVFKNAAASTFHPKIYLFKNKNAAEIVIGSGNLTEGGLFTNYEASVLFHLDLGVEEDARFLAAVEKALDDWSTPAKGLCYVLDDKLLDQLIKDGEVPDESNASGDGDEKDSKGRGGTSGGAGLFSRHKVPAAPAAAKGSSTGAGTGKAVRPAAGTGKAVRPGPSPTTTAQAFLMTLQRTDVGVGQTTKGASRRSPEIFIPLAARDRDPQFWGWPKQFKADRAYRGPRDGEGRGKMDRPGVPVFIGGAIIPVHFWYNPDKRDLRLRSEQMRSAGAIGDILYLERTDGSGGFSYVVDVVPTSSPRYAEYLARCTEAVKNSSKRFGYI